MRKADSSWRFYVNYWALNSIIAPDKYLIPVIKELIDDELYRTECFSNIDLRSRYHQIKVKSTDVHKTAFRTHSKHYEFQVMPFGLKNALATFQTIMNEAF